MPTVNRWEALNTKQRVVRVLRLSVLALLACLAIGGPLSALSGDASGLIAGLAVWVLLTAALSQFIHYPHDGNIRRTLTLLTVLLVGGVVAFALVVIIADAAGI